MTTGARFTPILMPIASVLELDGAENCTAGDLGRRLLTGRWPGATPGRCDCGVENLVNTAKQYGVDAVVCLCGLKGVGEGNSKRPGDCVTALGPVEDHFGP